MNKNVQVRNVRMTGSNRVVADLWGMDKRSVETILVSGDVPFLLERAESQGLTITNRVELNSATMELDEFRGWQKKQKF